MKTPGKVLLKAASILLIIFGAITALIPVVGLIGSAQEISLNGGLPYIIIVTIILILAVSVLELIIGAVGLKKYASPSKAGFFIITGIILCVLSLAGVILSIADGSFGFIMLAIPMGMLQLAAFVLPVLYIVGGCKSRKAAPANNNKH